jgi:hypothetical protein
MKGQLTLVGGGQIVLSKTGRPICLRCGHYLSSELHPDPKTGLFTTTIWCICDCYERFDRNGRLRT